MKVKKIGSMFVSLLILTACKPPDNMINNIPGGGGANTLLILVPKSNELKIYDTFTNRLMASIPTDTTPESIAVSPDQRLILVTAKNSGTISAYLRRDNNDIIRLNSFGNGNVPSGIAFNPRYSEAYAAYREDSKILVMGTAKVNETPAVIRTLVLPDSKPGEITVSDDGNRIFVTDMFNDRLIIISKTGAEFSINFVALGQPSENINLQSVLINDKNILFITDNAGDSLFVYDIKNNRMASRVMLRDNLVTGSKAVGPQNMIFHGEKLYITGNYASVVSVLLLFLLYRLLALNLIHRLIITSRE